MKDFARARGVKIPASDIELPSHITTSQRCKRLNPDYVSDILSAAEGTLKGLHISAACVHILLDDGPVRRAMGCHVLNYFIEINCALA